MPHQHTHPAILELGGESIALRSDEQTQGLTYCHGLHVIYCFRTYCPEVSLLLPMLTLRTGPLYLTMAIFKGLAQELLHWYGLKKKKLQRKCIVVILGKNKGGVWFVSWMFHPSRCFGRTHGISIQAPSLKKPHLRAQEWLSSRWRGRKETASEGAQLSRNRRITCLKF